jgi:hypothetical protein
MKCILFSAATILVLIFCFSCGPGDKSAGKKEMDSAVVVTPFRDNNGVLPPNSVYSGPLFKLSHNYPTAPEPALTNPSWVQALHGQPISEFNAVAYTDSLKKAVEPQVLKFLYDHASWDAGVAGWYSEPWTGDIREPILGSYVGSTFSASTFPQSGLKNTMTTFVLTFYDKRAAYTLGQIWGTDAMKPILSTTTTQFEEGSLIVKFAFTTADASQWQVMSGSDALPVYCALPPRDTIVKLRNLSFMQFDIIVKDSKTAPKTGWVFTTLVYDKDAKGKNAWEKMVPLGAMWGNDPKVNSTANPALALEETVINKLAPLYSKETLGWGGRLSGPNDGAVVPQATIAGKYAGSINASSCMSCHGPAEYKMRSFLLPGPTPTSDSDTLEIYPPGQAKWMEWFQDRNGTTPQDTNQIALDYDMVTSFKALRHWAKATRPATVSSFKAEEAFEKFRTKARNRESYSGH